MLSNYEADLIQNITAFDITTPWYNFHTKIIATFIIRSQPIQKQKAKKLHLCWKSFSIKKLRQLKEEKNKKSFVWEIFMKIEKTEKLTTIFSSNKTYCFSRFFFFSFACFCFCLFSLLLTKNTNFTYTTIGLFYKSFFPNE